MSYLTLKPDVPGDLGAQTQLDSSTHPPIVGVFHLDVTNWSGDDLVECFPCFAVTPALAAALDQAGLTGYSLSEMITTVNPDQHRINPNRRVPCFLRLVVDGKAGRDDAGVDSRHYLVVSDRLWALLRRFEISVCESTPWRSGCDGA
jgi:hypothetical protein